MFWLGSAGFVDIWDVQSGRLLQSINVESPVLKIIWIPQSLFCDAFLVGLEDGTLSLYCCRAPSYFTKLRDSVLDVFPFRFVSHSIQI